MDPLPTTHASCVNRFIIEGIKVKSLIVSHYFRCHAYFTQRRILVACHTCWTLENINSFRRRYYPRMPHESNDQKGNFGPSSGRASIVPLGGGAEVSILRLGLVGVVVVIPVVDSILVPIIHLIL